MSARPRLSNATLHQAPAHFLRPAYDRAGQKTGCVHIGVGAFHRAHQAVYFDALMNAGERDWNILGVSLRSAAVGDQLNPQDGLFCVSARSASEEEKRIVGALSAVLQAGAQSADITRTLADPSVSLVTITVTEKGYCLDPSTGGLDRAHPAIARDMDNPANPTSLPGVLVAGLAARRAAGAGGLTILSCDNLSHNGRATKAAVLDFAENAGGDLAGWIGNECAFPSSMVDRIVPATTAQDLDALEQDLGLRDEGAVNTERFMQWVIEDTFAARRPPLDSVGVQFTNDVAGWEHAKLRMLNAVHSSMAYLGALGSLDFIHEAIAFAPLRAHVEALWDEQAATLPPLAGFDPEGYRAQLLDRFANPALHHKTRQIATDGSQKLPPRLVAPLRERRAKGLACPHECLAIAAWMRWQMGVDESGAAFRVDDPLAATTAQLIARSGRDAAGIVRSLLMLEKVFGAGLAKDEHVVRELTRSLSDLLSLGARETLLRRL